MTYTERGLVPDSLTTPSSATCLEHNRRGLLSPYQRQRLAVYLEALGEVRATGVVFTLGAGASQRPTADDLRADLEAGVVVPVDGEVRWVRGVDLDSYVGEWRMLSPDGSARGLNGQSLPGSTRAYALPRYRLVVGVEPVAQHAQALAAYRATLAQAFGLGDDDLAANRAGRVGPRQRHLVRAAGHAVLGFILLGVGLLTGFVAVAPASLGEPGSALRSGDARLPLALVALAFLAPAVWILARDLLRAPGGAVRAVDGEVMREVTWERSYEPGADPAEDAYNRNIAAPYRRLFFLVGAERFDAQHLVDARMHSAVVLGLPHRVWFEEKTRAIVAVEPLGR